MSAKLEEARASMGDALTKYFDLMDSGEISNNGIALTENFVFEWGLYHITIPFPKRVEQINTEREAEAYNRGYKDAEERAIALMQEVMQA